MAVDAALALRGAVAKEERRKPCSKSASPDGHTDRRGIGAREVPVKVVCIS